MSGGRDRRAAQRPGQPEGRSPASVGLEVTALLGSISAMDDAIAHIDGVLNLATKAVRAIERGAPGDRARALSLLERAERFVPDAESLPPERRDDVRLMRASLTDLRARASALQE